jgi:hypothetical protein
MKRSLPPTYFLLALVAMTLLHFLWPIHRYWELPQSLIGLAPLTLGVFLNVVADHQFKRYQTTVKPFEQSTALVTAFPFSVSRNPMYLGITSRSSWTGASLASRSGCWRRNSGKSGTHTAHGYAAGSKHFCRLNTDGVESSPGAGAFRERAQ